MARVTLREVAEASGVSPSTVSFVLNDTPSQSISAPTRERVRRVAEELGYIPHGIAKALAEGSSRIVVLDFGSRPTPGNYARSFVYGLDAELAVHGHVLLVRYGQGSASSDRQVLEAIAPRAIHHFGRPYTDRGHELEDSGGGWRDGLAAHSALQIGHLAGTGHRHVAFAVPAEDALLTEVRQRFASEIAITAGLEPLVTLTVPRDRGAAAEVLRRFVASRPAVTAVATLDDEVALRILAAMHDLGLRAPDDLAVIGYDETEYAALSTPALTTVHIDAEAHGRINARVALGLPHDDVEPSPAYVSVRDSA